MTKEAAQEIIGEYVKTAEALLKQEYGDNYTSSTIEKLADTLIQLDQDAAMSKEASLIKEHAFDDELEKIGADMIGKAVKTISSGFKKYKSGLTGSGVEKLENRIGNLGKRKADRVLAKTLRGKAKTEGERVFKTRLYTGVGAAGVAGAGALGAGMSGGDR